LFGKHNGFEDLGVDGKILQMAFNKNAMLMCGMDLSGSG
jgi:hypothetical protein